MALLFIDSFDHYVTADFAKKWTILGTATGVPTISTGTGRHGSNAFRATASGNAGGSATSRPLTKLLPASGPTFIAGLSFTPVQLPFSSYRVTTTYDPGSNDSNFLMSMRVGLVHQVWFRINTNGSISVLRGTAVLATTMNALTFGIPHYIEFKVLIDPTVGTVDIKVNGQSWMSEINLNTRNAATAVWDEVVWANPVTQGTATMIWDIDDFYICDGSGGTPWNNFLGDCRVDVRKPTAEGTTIGWTPLSGTDNALMVDEAQDNGDTDYNSTSTLDAIDTFVVEDAAVPGATILGVQHVLSMKKVDAGVCTVAPVIRHSGLDYPGTALAPPMGAYTSQFQMQPTNPGTGVAWTEAGFNAAEFGYKRVS